MYYLYLLRCRDGSLYCGITTDVPRRVAQHNAGTKGARYTRSRRPVQLVYECECKTRAAAQSAEAKMKKLSKKDKELFIASSKSG